jgi:hypothetical protein
VQNCSSLKIQQDLCTHAKERREKKQTMREAKPQLGTKNSNQRS